MGRKDNYILAYDMGTSGTKAVLTDLKGGIRYSAHASYPMLFPEPDAAEQEPDVLWRAFVRTTRELLDTSGIAPAQVAGIGVSTQAFNLLPVDAQGRPLMNMISWADLRSVAQTERILDDIGMDAFYGWTGNAPRAKDVIPRIVWLREKHPDIWKRTHLLINCQEYILHRLTGRFAMDLHSASIFFLLDHRRRSWSREACEALGIPLDKLPPVYPCTEQLGGVGATAAAATGLLGGTPVILCPADVGAAQVGAGTMSAGRANLCLGTGGWVCAASRKLVNPPESPFWALCHVDPAMWIIGGALDTSGSGLAWFADLFCQEQVSQARTRGESPYATLSSMAATVSPASEGLVFIPWVYGERGHVGVEHYARGAFVGLGLNHSQAHMSRAVMEGVACQYRWYLEELEGAGLEIERINLIGGGCSSPVWTQIISDITDRALNILAWPQETGSVGAALVTMLGLGIYPDFASIENLVHCRGTVTPRGDGAYAALYRDYREISDGLMNTYTRRYRRDRTE